MDALVATVGSADSLFAGTPHPNLFGFSGNLEAQEQRVVRQLVAMKIKNIGIIAANNAAGIQSTQYLQYVAQREGITAHVVLAPPTVTDATPQLQQLQADGAQHLVVVGFTAVVGAALAAPDEARLGHTCVLRLRLRCDQLVDRPGVELDEVLRRDHIDHRSRDCSEP